LWLGDFRRVAACAADPTKADKISSRCQKFLDGSERARMQWHLEREFGQFEEKF